MITGLSEQSGEGGYESLGWTATGRAAGVEVLCWHQGWKGQAQVILQLAWYVGSFLLEAAKLEVGGGIVQFRRGVKSLRDVTPCCGEQLQQS